MTIRIVAVLLASLIASCQADSTAPPTGSAITNVTVIDAVNGVRENQTVVFDRDEILAIQPADADLNVAEAIDGSGKYLIPGLWDFHVHLSYEDTFGDSMSSLFLSYGITSVRDTGGLLRKVLPIVEKMRADGAIAPRVYYAGPLMDGNFVVYDGVSRPEIGTQNATPEQARAKVAELKANGVSFIKLYEMISPAVFDALVAAANEHELPMDSHVPLSLRASSAAPNVDSMEHLRNIELDCASNAPELHETRLALLKNPAGLSGAELRSSLHNLQRDAAIANYAESRCDETIAALTGTIQVPTLQLSGSGVLPPYEREGWETAFARLPMAVREDWQQSVDTRMSSDRPVDSTFFDWSLFLIERMNSRGVPIAAGTDTPLGLSVPGYSLHSELELLVRAGLTPVEALYSATVRPAEFFSLQDEMGTIAAGKKADLVLLDANPLDDITNTKEIAAVVTQGRYLSRTELDALIQSAQEAER